MPDLYKLHELYQKLHQKVEIDSEAAMYAFVDEERERKELPKQIEQASNEFKANLTRKLISPGFLTDPEYAKLVAEVMVDALHAYVKEKVANDGRVNFSKLGAWRKIMEAKDIGDMRNIIKENQNVGVNFILGIFKKQDEFGKILANFGEKLETRASKQKLQGEAVEFEMKEGVGKTK